MKFLGMSRIRSPQVPAVVVAFAGTVGLKNSAAAHSFLLGKLWSGRILLLCEHNVELDFIIGSLTLLTALIVPVMMKHSVRNSVLNCYEIFTSGPTELRWKLMFFGKQRG